MGRWPQGCSCSPSSGPATSTPIDRRPAAGPGASAWSGCVLEPQFASVVGVVGPLSTVTPVPPTPGLPLPPTPPPWGAPPPVAPSSELVFGGGDQVHPPMRARLPRLTRPETSAVRCMGAFLASLQTMPVPVECPRPIDYLATFFRRLQKEERAQDGPRCAVVVGQNPDRIQSGSRIAASGWNPFNRSWRAVATTARHR